MDALVRMKDFSKEFLYRGVKIMMLNIKYPVVVIMGGVAAQGRINRQIIMEVNKFYKHVSGSMYNNAVDFYLDSLKHDFPFHGFEAYMEYNITYNENCFLSYYYDKYEYTGGAHGITNRGSSTYNLKNGRILPLSYLFKDGVDYKMLIIKEIVNQANQNLEENPSIYFDNYTELIYKTFNENQYFLTPNGLSVYFQQYDIAPYSTGIVVFDIPYEMIGWEPSC